MTSCTIFNQPLDTSRITNCGYCFLQSCKAFNQSLDLNNLEYTGTSNNVGGFLGHCEAYNKTLSLPKIREFGGLNYMKELNSNVTFGPYLSKLTNWTFSHNDKMCKTYNFDTVNPNNVSFGYWDSLFCTANVNTDAYTNGVKIAGSYRSTWMSKCPNHSSGTFTRRLINAGY
jgi:hypothetical protein